MTFLVRCSFDDKDRLDFVFEDLNDSNKFNVLQWPPAAAEQQERLHELRLSQQQPSPQKLKGRGSQIKHSPGQ